MMSGMSVRATASECHISKDSSFYLRHKIFDALQGMEAHVKLDGVVEADETYFSLSFKRSHKDSKKFKMPRKPHKMGLSAEQICLSSRKNGWTECSPFST
jgi:hypothetical protein